MCGRYVSVRSDADLLAEFDAEPSPGERTVEADYNVAPTKPVRAIVAAGTRTMTVMSWGLVPAWAAERGIGGRLVNARAETVRSKPAYRDAYAARRCIVPADGWFEWRAGYGGDKLPYYLTPEDGRPLAFAGLYEHGHGTGSLLQTCAIVTTASARALAEIHDRMPLVLPRAAWARWLDPAVAEPDELISSNDLMTRHIELRPVGRAVNDVRNNGAELIEPVAPRAEPQVLF